MNTAAHPSEFIVRNCSLAAIAPAVSAGSLVELRDKIATVDEGCIYHHFWGGRMNPQFIQAQYHNDFASWVNHRLHDRVLAERLNVIDPTEYKTLEDLRQGLMESIENRLDDYEIVLWTKKEDRFYFISSTIIIFESEIVIKTPADLPQIFPTLTPSSVYYHFIDARARTKDSTDDFSTWIKTFGEDYHGLIENIQAIDPYFLSLTELKDQLTVVMRDFFKIRGI
jgi:hypothetical protein